MCRNRAEIRSPLVENIRGTPQATALDAPIEPPPADDVNLEIVPCMEAVLHRIAQASQRAGRAQSPRLVAVSKIQPLSSVLAAHSAGCVHFGENYVQELLDKAPQCPKDIRWHFIGQLQSNKAKPLVLGVPNLWAVESVDSEKLAGLLEKAAVTAGRGKALDIGGAEGEGEGGGGGGGGSSGSEAPGLPISAQPLRVFVQVNTSGEEQKGGVEPGEAAKLVHYIRGSCPHLRFMGLMTIGKLGEVATSFFERLVQERDAVARELGMSSAEAAAMELSMGMSGDFELAIEAGSSSVRVGSAIFGARAPKVSS
jgi:uncharacterized pyridoxal phosphate-containing UPF0001 family protein